MRLLSNFCPTFVGQKSHFYYLVLTLVSLANKIIPVTQNYVQLAIGIWILVSPWLLGFSSISIMTWSNLIVGMILVLINIWAIFGESTENAERSSSQTNN